MTPTLPDILAVVIVFAVSFCGSYGALASWDRWTRRRSRLALDAARDALMEEIRRPSSLVASCATVGTFVRGDDSDGGSA